MADPAHLPTISIVTPSYNQGQFIERTIQSVLLQEYPNLEYIVVDGGSTDSTLTVLKKYSSRIRWISEKDAGQSDAINKGLRMSHGEIVGYLNSDDLLLPGALFTIASYFQKHPNTAWVTGQARIVNNNDQVIGRWSTWYKNFLLRHYHSNVLLIINFLAQMSTFWRRSALYSVGDFSTAHHLAMDYDYWLRLLQISPPGVIREDLSCFRVHENAKGSERFVEQFAESYSVASPYIHNPLLRACSWLHNKLVTVVYRMKIR